MVEEEVKFDEEVMEDSDEPTKTDEDANVPEYSSKSDFSKGAVVQEAVKKCISLRSDEMRSGHWNYTMNNNIQNKIWITDTRDRFVSSVVALRNLLGAEIIREEDYKKSIEELEKEVEKVFDKYAYSPYISKVQEGGQPIFTENKEIKYMPKQESAVYIPIFDNRMNRNVMKEIPCGWDSMIDAYKENLLVIYDKIFRELNILMDKINYFKKESSW